MSDAGVCVYACHALDVAEDSKLRILKTFATFAVCEITVYKSVYADWCADRTTDGAFVATFHSRQHDAVVVLRNYTHGNGGRRATVHGVRWILPSRRELTFCARCATCTENGWHGDDVAKLLVSLGLPNAEGEFRDVARAVVGLLVRRLNQVVAGWPEERSKAEEAFCAMLARVQELA